MTYRILPDALRDTAEIVRKYLKDELGLTRIEIESALADDIEWRPTLTGVTRDHHIVCVEVTSGGYTDALDGFALDCMNRGIPTKLYIAFPDEGGQGEADRVLKLFSKARDRGIGILLVKGNRCRTLAAPIELSLASVRRLDPKDLLQKYRQPLKDAEETFLAGDPVSGCGRVYAELETLSRKVAAKTYDLGWWNGSGIKPQKFGTHSWNDLCKKWHKHLDYAATNLKCPNLTEQLLSTIVGLAPKRNETGPHKPKDRSALMKRDRDLRTRFEHSIEVFIELQNAARPLRL